MSSPAFVPYDARKPYHYSAISEIAADGLEARDNRPLAETISITHNGITHATVKTDDILTGAEAETLARALAAAPALISAAKTALELLAVHGLDKINGRWTHAARELRAAIRQAGAR